MTKDPFQDVIPRALLSASDIYDYVRVTGMVYPFYPERLKGSSYKVPIRGEVIFWEEDGARHDRLIDEGSQPLELKPNSITFAQVEPHFRLPHYIAFRFNLRITHVHRGLLLGTGPLVDPGFRGKLLIPLHNLTATPYKMDLSKELIWLEFTKTTYGRDQTRGETKYHFPLSKINLSPDDYLRKANGGRPIISSIPVAIDESRKQAEAARIQAEAAGKQATI